MLDQEGFRPNVGIVLLNKKNQIFLGKRIGELSWQLPQGGIKSEESPEQAMLRELFEEVGLLPKHVTILGRTRDWLRYEVPEHYVRRDIRGHYRGQKQIWFLLKMLGQDSDIQLLNNPKPEFDAWRWEKYWQAPDLVIDFKKQVYQLALEELEQFINTQPFTPST